MKFKFALHALLKVRKFKRDEAERDFRLSQSRVLEQTLVFQNMKSDLDSAQFEVQAVRVSGGKLVGSLISLEEFIVGQKVRIRSQARSVKGLEEIADQKREILVEAAREFKILEKLKAKRYAEFRKLRQKREAKILDEISTQNYARRVTE